VRLAEGVVRTVVVGSWTVVGQEAEVELEEEAERKWAFEARKD